MAIYHLSARVGRRSGGQSAVAKTLYIERASRYRRCGDSCRNVESGNMPAWAATSPRSYWRAADQYERANGVLFREIEFALPVELSPPEQLALARQFADQVSRVPGGKLPFTLAVHEGYGRNPHAHLVMSERISDGIERGPETWFKRAAPLGADPRSGGARKADIASWRRNWLAETRAAWAAMANAALARAGHAARIDNRSYVAQGVDRDPAPKLGPAIAAMERRGIRTRVGDRERARRAHERQRLADTSQADWEAEHEGRAEQEREIAITHAPRPAQRQRSALAGLAASVSIKRQIERESERLQRELLRLLLEKHRPRRPRPLPPALRAARTERIRPALRTAQQLAKMRAKRVFVGSTIAAKNRAIQQRGLEHEQRKIRQQRERAAEAAAANAARCADEAARSAPRNQSPTLRMGPRPK